MTSNHTNFAEIFARSPKLTSENSGWNNIGLETFCLPPGETPEFCLDRYSISTNVGSKVRASHCIEGKYSQATFFQGTAVICPIHRPHFFWWESTLQIATLNLKPELLHLHAIELWGQEDVELIPHFGFQDELIHQMGLALNSDLRSPGGSNRLYAETMANALAVHLLRNYSTQKQRSIGDNAAISQHKLRWIIDYIHDNLERDLSLQELAAIAQLSQYHFCRVFRQEIGLSPHQYVIQQRIEKAKKLLQKGGMSIGAVAIACGFSHQSHLNRHFKRWTGVTPKTFLNS